MTLGPARRRSWPTRIGGFVTEGDVERRYQTRVASMELDKLALYRDDGPVTVDDVRALVAEAIPGSIWAFSDAVGERKPVQPLALLDACSRRPRSRSCSRSSTGGSASCSRSATGWRPGERSPSCCQGDGIASEFRARTLAAQARAGRCPSCTPRWTACSSSTRWSRARRAPFADAAQRRLAFTLWVIDHVGVRPGERPGQP